MSRQPEITAVYSVVTKVSSRDPQQHLVYNMEREFSGGCVATTTHREYLMEMGQKLCELYNVPVPKLVISGETKEKDGSGGEYDTESGIIFLYKKTWGVNLITYLHELAHHVSYRLHGDDREPDHGPIFCSVYMYMLYKTRILPMEAFRALAKKYGVKIHYEWRPSALYRRRTVND